MANITLVFPWIIQDLCVFGVALATIFFIIRKEEHPESVLMEMLCFVVLYAAVYENFATIVGYYAYGRSLVMIGNVPLSVPLVEYLVVYSSLRMLKQMRLPAWSRPAIVGFGAMLFDFALDPLAIKLVFATKEGTVGRWTWFLGPGDAAIYGEPVFNFSGWVLICGYAAALILLGRYWHRKSGNSPVVGFLYPVLAMLVSLGLVISPLSNFLLWCGPFFARGSVGEWIMLGFWLIAPIVLLAALWIGRGRLRERFLPRENVPVLLTLAGLPLATVVFTIIYGQFEVLWLEAVAAALLSLLVLVASLPRRAALRAPAPESAKLRSADLQ